MYTHLSSIFGSGVSVKGRCETVIHMDVVNADIAGANICPWKLDDSILAVNIFAKHTTAKYPSAKISSVMGITVSVKLPLLLTPLAYFPEDNAVIGKSNR